MDHDLFDGTDGEFQMSMSMFPNSGMPAVDPSHVWHDPEFSSGAFSSSKHIKAALKSAQGEIVSRREQVEEQFGQITPPEDTNSLGAPSPADPLEVKCIVQEDMAKKNRTQRARNAANTRHSKSKTARRDSMQEGESDMGESAKGQGKSTNVQREKNRLAAAKCRAKKKATSEDMQENHREGSKQNSYLHREMRELRDQKAFLRNSLLQHEPGVCQCHAIHRFNFAQAQQLAMGVGAMIGQPLSPQDSVGSAITPGSDGSLGHNGLPAQGGIPRRPSMSSSRPQSFNTGSSFNAGQINGPEAYPAASIHPDQSISGQFADFIYSSPNGGRSGFA